MTTHLVIPDAHAHYQHHNKRAEWVGKLILDLRPDLLVNLGDTADMPSLSGYDKGRSTFVGRTYRKDIDVHNDFQDRMFWPIKKAKKRQPRSIMLIGNHEHRIQRALDVQPELQGTISLSDLDLEKYYDEVIHYEGGTPGIIIQNGITYSHYLISGVMGRAISGEHPAYSLLSKRFTSSTVGHLHTLDYCIRTQNNRKIMGLVAGCYQDYRADWAGDSNSLWWSGVIIKRNVENGQYDPEFVSIKRLKELYG